MLATTQLSERGYHLVRTFRAAFAALADHRSDAERQQIAEVIAAHLRSSAPMALLGVSDAIEPATEAVLCLDDNARIELRMLDGRLNLYVLDGCEHDADVGLTATQATQLIASARRVLAGMERS